MTPDISSVGSERSYNSDVPDYNLNGLKLILMEEMWQWFKFNPELLSTTKLFKKLLMFTINKYENIRLSALRVCYKLIKTTRFTEQLMPLMRTFVDSVKCRLKDVSDKVITSAINIFSQLLNTYPNCVSEGLCKLMNSFVFLEFCPLAVEAGKFLLTYIYSKTTSHEARDVIPLLVTFVRIEQTEHCEILLVESILPNCSKLLEWDVMMELLLNDRSEKILLLNIMCEAGHHVLTGKSSIPRKQSYEKKRNIKDKRTFIHKFLSNLGNLLEYNCDYINCLKIILKTLSIIDFEDSSLFVKDIQLENSVKLLRNIYYMKNDAELLMAISEVFAKLGKENSVFRLQIETTVSSVIQIAVDIFSRMNLENIITHQEISKNKQFALEQNLLRLWKLFMFHDMTTVSFQSIVRNCSNLEKTISSNSMKYLISSGCWHLIWKLRKLITKTSDVTDEEEINIVQQNFSRYISITFALMKSTDNSIRNAAFGCVSELTLTCNTELIMLEENSPFKALAPVFDDRNNYCNELMDFTIKFIFEDYNASTLELRCSTLNKIFNMISMGIIPSTKTPCLYKYYATHHVIYGDIFEKYLAHIEKLENGNLSIALIALHSIIDLFNDVLTARVGAMDTLTALVKQYQLLFLPKKSLTETILCFGIKYALSSRNNYVLLRYLKYFMASLPPGKRRSLLGNYKSLMREDNDIFREFNHYARYAKMLTTYAQSATSSSNTTESASQSHVIDEDSD